MLKQHNKIMTAAMMGMILKSKVLSKNGLAIAYVIIP
jgi:hypothetical protein